MKVQSPIERIFVVYLCVLKVNQYVHSFTARLKLRNDFLEVSKVKFQKVPSTIDYKLIPLSSTSNDQETEIEKNGKEVEKDVIISMVDQSEKVINDVGSKVNGSYEKANGKSNNEKSHRRSIFKFGYRSKWFPNKNKSEKDQKNESNVLVNGQQNPKQQQTFVGDTSPSTLNGTVPTTSNSLSPDSITEVANATLATAQEAVDEVTRELTNLINDGLDDLWTRNQNITRAIEEQVEFLTRESALSANEIVDTFSKAIAELQEDQRSQLIYMQNKAEKKIVELVEDLAFADADIMNPEQRSSKNSNKKNFADLPHQTNTTMSLSKNLRSREMFRYWKAAPLYYTVALLFRWINKAPGPRTIWLGTSRCVSRVLGGQKNWRGTSVEDAYQAYISNADAMQSGWKRTGEIASKGPMRRQMEIFRRSLEIWSYFTSFYLKEKRMLKKFKTGKWTEEQFSQGRSQLGAEVTQNLLKLGPTFIKVRLIFSQACIRYLFSFDLCLSFSSLT